MRRVLFLAQHTPLPEPEIPPHGSGAHVAASLAGLRRHFDVLPLGAPRDGAAPDSTDAPAWRRAVPGRVRGLRQDVLAARRDRAFARRALALAEQFRPDVVYERSEYFSIAGLRVAAQLGIPLVLEVNGLHDIDVRLYYRSLAEPVGAARERRKHSHANAVVVESPGMRDQLVARGVPPGRIAVVPNSVSPERVAQHARTARAGAASIGWIGHLMSWHRAGVLALVAAAPEVLRAAPRTRFVVIGDGPGMADVRSRVAVVGLADAFDFRGVIPFAEVPAALATVEIGVVPGVFPDKFPVKLVEMGAAGLPVLAARSPSLDGLLAPGVEYEPYDASRPGDLADTLRRLVLDLDRRDRLAVALHAAVSERFTWRTTALALANVVEGVIEGAPG